MSEHVHEAVLVVERKKVIKGAVYVLSALGAAAGIIWGMAAVSANNENRLSRVEEAATFANEVPLIKKDIEVLKDALIDVRDNTRRTNELLVDILRKGALTPARGDHGL